MIEIFSRSLATIFCVIVLVVSALMLWPSLVQAGRRFPIRDLFHLPYPPETFFDGPGLELAQAIKKKNPNLTPFLANAGDLKHEYKEGMTLLYYAMWCQNTKAMTELMRQGADPRQEIKDFGSVLELAIQSKYPKYLAAILDAGVSPNSRDTWGTPYLHWAAKNSSMGTFQLLVERGADINATDGLQQTAIYDALNSREYDKVEYLLNKGAKVDMTNVNGVTLGYCVQWDLDRRKAYPKTPAYKKLLKIKLRMEKQGIKFPADPPPVVRERMKAQGLKGVE